MYCFYIKMQIGDYYRQVQMVTVVILLSVCHFSVQNPYLRKKVLGRNVADCTYYLYEQGFYMHAILCLCIVVGLCVSANNFLQLDYSVK